MSLLSKLLGNQKAEEREVGEYRALNGLVSFGCLLRLLQRTLVLKHNEEMVKLKRGLIPCHRIM